jgi:hypothetical protein
MTHHKQDRKLFHHSMGFSPICTMNALA